jgi:putative hydrolase of the HAD superfamily
MQAGEMTERDYWGLRMAETAALVGETWTEFPEFIARVRGSDPAAVIRPEALDAISRAKAEGHRLAILSNELDLFYGKAFRSKLPFLADFDLIVDATYTGILKPDRRAFGFVTDGLDLPAADCVFVDDQKKNLKGAEDVGMPCVHFDVTRPGASYDTALDLLQARKG